MDPSENPYESPKTGSQPEIPPVLAPTLQGSPTKVRWGVLAFSVTMGIILYLDRYAIAVAQPIMMEELGITKTQMGYAVSAFFYVYALMQIPSGWLSDSFGARITLTCYIVAWSLVMALLGLSYSLLMLVALRGLMGFFQAGAYPTTAGFLKSWIPLNRRGFANSTVSMGGRTGGLLSNLITAPLMLLVGAVIGFQTGQWRIVFGAYALLGIIWAVFFWKWFRNTPQEHSHVNAAELELIQHGKPVAGKDEKQSLKLPIVEMLTSPNMWLLCAINFFVNIGWIFLATWMPTYLKEVHSMPLWVAGLMTAVTALCGMAGSISGGLATDFLVRRYGIVWGRRIPGIVSSIGAGLLYLSCLWLDNGFLFVVVFSGAYFLVDFGLAAIWSTYQDIGGKNVAAILGFANMCGNFGAAIFAGIIGSLAEEKQWTLVFMISSGSFVVTLICWLFVNPRVQMTKDEVAEA